jgi:O-antigen ligase
MQNNRTKENNLIRRIAGSEATSNTVPWLNTVTAAYLGLVLVLYVLLLIAPFLTFLASTPFYHISAILGILGGVLLAADLLTNRVLWRGPMCLLLYGICLAACLSSLRTLQYGLHDNLFDICWVVIQLALVYSWRYRLRDGQADRFIRIIYSVTALAWFAACVVSFVQYVLLIGYAYIADPMSLNPELTRQGFLYHRLFGVFTGLDYSVYISLILSIVGVYFITSGTRLWKKILLGIMMAFFFMHMVLSGSRSVQISLFLYVFFYTWLRMRERITAEGIRKALSLLLVSAIATGIFAGAFFGSKWMLRYVPALVNPDMDWNDPLPENDILEREDLEGDVSNNRFLIWKDYLGMYRDIGVVGLSLSNYNDYIKDRHPDLYIVQHFQEYEEAEKQDMVYESHNNYIFVFVATGLIGLALFLAFFFLAAYRIIRFIRREEHLSGAFIAALAVVCVGCVQALFMNSVFLKINGPSFIFWFALGMVLHDISRKGEPSAQPV